MALLVAASVCASGGTATADPGACTSGDADGNTTSISIDSGNVFSATSPGSTTTNNVVGNLAVGNGTGNSTTVCCVQSVCCVHSGAEGGNNYSICPPG